MTLTGTTGARTELSSALAGLVARVRPLAGDVPLYAGFGISTPEQAAAAAALADGIVVGSRAVQVAEEGRRRSASTSPRSAQRSNSAGSTVALPPLGAVSAEADPNALAAALAPLPALGEEETPALRHLVPEHAGSGTRITLEPPDRPPARPEIRCKFDPLTRPHDPILRTTVDSPVRGTRRGPRSADTRDVTRLLRLLLVFGALAAILVG